MDKAEQPTTQADNNLWAGLDHIAHFINALDSSEMSAKDVRTAIYAECLAPKGIARTTSLAAQDGLVEALEWISKICDEEIPLEYNDAMRKAFQRNIRDAARKALSAIKEQHHD